MTLYTATLSNGQTFTRNSTRGNYTHGWALVRADGQMSGWRGFASSEEKARKAGRVYLAYYKGSRVEVVPATADESTAA